MVIRVAIIGMGKIARDQHVPSIRNDPRFDLVATVSPNGRMEGVTAYRDLEDLIAAGGVDAVAICTPPDIRHGLALRAIEAGWHVMLEKPPAATVALAEDIGVQARAAGVTAFATWHSREAAAVDVARDWLRDKKIDRIRISWRENIREWHPGQDWLLTEAGFGVFDPAINAFSILTKLVPGAVATESATLMIPANREAPIAADLRFRTAGGVPVEVDLDFLETGRQVWTIAITTDAGECTLLDGGARFVTPEGEVEVESAGEYPRLYARFADLLAAGETDVDATPLAMVSDALRLGTRRVAASFDF